MADIVDFDEFKKRKLGDAIAEWEQFMARAEQFQKEGKDKFAAQMLAKAKEARKVIDKLRGPKPKVEARTPYITHRAEPVYNFRSLFTSPPETTPTA